MNNLPIGILGIVAILAIAFALSSNRRAIRLRVVGAAFALQTGIAVLVLYVPAGRAVIEGMSRGVSALLGYAQAGTDFIFGPLAKPEMGGHSFAIAALPVIIFFASLVSILYYLRIMPLVIRWIGGAIEKVTGDMDRRFAFNTAIAAVMELINEVSRLRESAGPEAQRFALETASSLCFPFAPHVTTDAYFLLTGERLWEQPWPTADAAMLERDTYELVCQVNGKLRDTLTVAKGLPKDQIEAAALASDKVVRILEGKLPRKVIVVPDRLVNLVA